MPVRTIWWVCKGWVEIHWRGSLSWTMFLLLVKRHDLGCVSSISPIRGLFFLPVSLSFALSERRIRIFSWNPGHSNILDLLFSWIICTRVRSRALFLTTLHIFSLLIVLCFSSSLELWDTNPSVLLSCVEIIQNPTINTPANSKNKN